MHFVPKRKITIDYSNICCHCHYGLIRHWYKHPHTIFIHVPLRTTISRSCCELPRFVYIRLQHNSHSHIQQRMIKKNNIPLCMQPKTLKAEGSACSQRHFLTSAGVSGGDSLRKGATQVRGGYIKKWEEC